MICSCIIVMKQAVGGRTAAKRGSVAAFFRLLLPDGLRGEAIPPRGMRRKPDCLPRLREDASQQNEEPLLLPEASGIIVYEGAGVTIDASHTDQGYVMIRCEPGEKRLKATHLRPSAQTYYYDLPGGEGIQRVSVADGRRRIYRPRDGTGGERSVRRTLRR